MCGIAGMLRLDGAPADASRLDPMLDTIRHRGPNGRGTWADGPVALGHVRLSVIDLSERAHQPMRTDDGQGVLVYNGEIYNFPELRRSLEEEGATFQSSGDAEVVLEALHRWGPRVAVPRFDGMFALAYVDRRNGSLWLARDRLGIKSVCVTERGGALLFCSEAKGLLAHPDVPRRVDRRAVDMMMVYGRQLADDSLFEGIHSLAAGTIRRVRNGHSDTTAYFRLPRDIDVGRIVRADTNLEAAADHLASTLEASVRAHLISDAPLATMCSGGVDSSLITAIAKDLRPDVEAYVADVGGQVSEAAQALRVGRHLDVPVHVVDAGPEAFLRLWADVTWHRDEPSSHPSDGPLLEVARTCHARGVKVLLTGEGADELFGGYSWYRNTWALWRRARRRSRMPWPFRKPWSSRWRRWKHMAHGGGIARDERRLRFRLGAAMAAPLEFRREAIHAHLAAIEPAEDRAFLAHQIDDLHTHLAWILHRHDRVAMGASIEMRVPFLENRMIDLALHMPRALKLHRKRGKWVLKQVAERRLPREVVHAGKKGFPVPRASYAGHTELLRSGFVQDVQRWTDAETERVIAGLADDRMFEYRLVGFEIWGRLFCHGETPAQVTERLLAHGPLKPR